MTAPEASIAAQAIPRSLDERFNWHPLVHSRFGETLYFYLIRLREPLLGPVAGQVRRALGAAGIRYACEYTVFGHWDALVRVWLTQASRHRLHHVLDRESANVADYQEFQSASIRYLWSGDDSDMAAPDNRVSEAVAERRGDILSVAAAPDREDAGRDSRLVGAGLLIERPAVRTTSVKFYISLTRTGGELRSSDEGQKIVAAVREAGLSDRGSVYAGSGHFADYLIRCVADSYDEVLTYTAALDKGLSTMRVRPMTLLVANSDAHESDNINDLYALTTHDESTLLLLDLGDQGKSLLERLPDEQRGALNRLVDDAYELSANDTRLRKKLQGLLRASLQNDRDAITSSAAFLLEFEWLLGQYLRRAWAEVFGPQWITRLVDAFGESDHAREAEAVVKPEEWTLGSCVRMALTAAELNEKVDNRLTRHLGERWKAQMRTLIDVRNMLAHGKLRSVERFDDFTGEWGGTLSQLLNIATLHFRCERLLDLERPVPDE